MFAITLALLIAATVTLVLPIVSFVQTLALRRRIAELEARLAAIERGAGRASSAPTTPKPDARVGAELARPPSEPSEPARPSIVAPPPSPIEPPPILAPAIEPVREPIAPPPPAITAPESLETAIGSRWMLYVGITVLLLGLSFFLKLAIDSGWINETTRVLLGCAAGAALTAGGISFVRRGYAGYGHILAGGGIAVFYFSIYAAFAFYGLISQAAAFTLFVMVTIGGAVLADRQASQPLALVAVIGGFWTPFLLGREGGSHVVLFTYDALLIAGTTALARRHDWPALNLASFMLTVFTVAAWSSTAYRPSLYLSVEIFLTLFCAMFLATQARPIRIAAAILYYIASLTILYPHATAYLVYLTAFTAAGIALSVQRQNTWIRLVVWLGAWGPALAWIDDHANSEWLGRIGAMIGALYVMHLLAALRRISDNEALDDPEIGLVHLNGLGLLAAAYLALEQIHPLWIPPLAFGLAAWNGAVAAALWRRDAGAALHWIALAGVLTATGIALQFDGVWVTVGWAAEGGALLWLTRRVARRWMWASGMLLLTLAALRVVGPDYQAFRVGMTPILNPRFAAAALIVALLYFARGTPAVIGANILTLVVLTQEIAAYAPQSESPATSLFRAALMSITWAVYAAGLIAVGIRRSYPAIRYLALAVFALTVVKVFAVDLANLGGIYRVLGFLIVGAVLLGASFLYQRQVKRGGSR